MTYKLASKIRALVDQVSSTWNNDPYVCALECNSETEDSWSCHLFERKGVNGYKGELWILAMAIQRAGLGIRITESSYNRGTTKVENVESIEMY